jgi:hypothetical protein
MSDQVARWRAQAEHARAQAGLSEQEVPTEALLAIIHVESLGQPDAHREGAQYYGLTQVGWAAAIDGGILSREPYDRLRAAVAAATTDEERTKARAALSRWKRTAAKVALDPDLALLALCRCIARYKSRVLYAGVTPIEGVAIMWKAGAGSSRIVQADLRAGKSLEQALIARERAGIPNVREYIRRANAAAKLYSGRPNATCKTCGQPVG